MRTQPRKDMHQKMTYIHKQTNNRKGKTKNSADAADSRRSVCAITLVARTTVTRVPRRMTIAVMK